LAALLLARRQPRRVALVALVALTEEVLVGVGVGRPHARALAGELALLRGLALLHRAVVVVVGLLVARPLLLGLPRAPIVVRVLVADPRALARSLAREVVELGFLVPAAAADLGRRRLRLREASRAPLKLRLEPHSPDQ